MTSLELTQKIVSILDKKKALNIRVIKIRDLTVLSDYFIIASGTSTTHVRSLCDEVEFQMKNNDGVLPDHTEGRDSRQWILMDYESVVLHVFSGETREFYDLERLWKDGEQISLSQLGIQE